MDNIIYLLDQLDAEGFMDIISTFNMKEYYTLKYKSQDFNKYNIYWGATMLTRGGLLQDYEWIDTNHCKKWSMEGVSKELNWVLKTRPGLKAFMCKRKPYQTISKLKLWYFVIGGVQKILSIEHLNTNYPVVQWDMGRLFLIFNCTLGLKSQDVELTNEFSQDDIPKVERFYI